MRKVFYSYLRVEKDYPWEGESIIRFEKGDALHDMIRNWLRTAGVLVEYKNKTNGEVPKHFATGLPDPEFPVSDLDLDIRKAKIDAVILLEGIEGIKDGAWLVEVKTKNSRGFQDLSKPEDRHIEQATIYAYLFEVCLNKGDYDHIPELEEVKEVNGVIYIYLNREASEDAEDGDDWEEFICEKDPKVFKKIVSKIIEIHKNVETKTLPEKTWDYCKTCNYREKCLKDFNPLD